MTHRADAGWCLWIVLAWLVGMGLAEPRRAWAQGHDRPAGPLHRGLATILAPGIA